MRIFDETKTIELKLNNLDLNKGHLIMDTKIIHHDKIDAITEIGHYETTAVYENGGRDVAWVIDIKGKDAVDAWDETEIIQIYKPYTKLELINMHMQKTRNRLSETDFKTMKYYEGSYTDEEYEPIRQERKHLREELNFLEKQIRDIELYQKDKEE